MTRKVSETLQATCDELDAAECRYAVEKGRKHYRVYVEGVGPIFCSVTVSDHRAAHKARAFVRRLLKRSA